MDEGPDNYSVVLKIYINQMRKPNQQEKVFLFLYLCSMLNK